MILPPKLWRCRSKRGAVPWNRRLPRSAVSARMVNDG